MQTYWGRAVICAVAVPGALALLSGCGSIEGAHGSIQLNTSAAQAGASGTASPTDEGADNVAKPSASADSASADPKGCASGGAALPDNASLAKTVDLDGDGKADKVWLGFKGANRTLGVVTASGARFSTSFQSTLTTSLGEPTTASAVAGRLGDGSAVILLDLGQEARLYAVTGCQIVPTLNTQGNQYTFDKDVNGYGSGAGCPTIEGKRTLVGYLAKPGGHGDGYTVTLTVINLSKNGTRADNGSVRTVEEGQLETDPLVVQARTVECAGERAVEPAG